MQTPPGWWGSARSVEIFEFSAFRQDRHSPKQPPLTRNQELLAEIQAKWAARTPEEIRLAEFRGTEEELKAVQRRYDRLAESMPPHPWPSEIAKEAKRAPQADGSAKDKGNDTGNSM